MATVTCFVIMPFGEKPNVDGKIIDFDKIYQYLIKKTVEGMGIVCVRCDEIAEAGWIHAKMFEHIYSSDVAIADITSLNPNVLYELGVRHALVDSGTVLMRREGTAIPFNIRGFKVIDYDDQDIEKVEEARKKLVDFIKNGLKLKQKDSPVHEVLDLKIGTTPRRLNRTEVFEYRLARVESKRVCLITGDLRDVKGIDVWVNSENTNMQMARHFDLSVSSVIRYCGALKKDGRILDDVIFKELATAAGSDPNVPAGDIIVTGAGDLQRTNGVKKIFHAAAVIGQVGSGYKAIDDIGRCVRNALRKADEDPIDAELRSILFPLLGTGTARGELEPKARELISAAISHLEANPHGRIEKVYFLTWSEKDLEVCQHVLQADPNVLVG